MIGIHLCDHPGCNRKSTRAFGQRGVGAPDILCCDRHDPREAADAGEKGRRADREHAIAFALMLPRYLAASLPERMLIDECVGAVVDPGEDVVVREFALGLIRQAMFGMDEAQP